MLKEQTFMGKAIDHRFRAIMLFLLTIRDQYASAPILWIEIILMIDLNSSKICSK